MNELQLALKIIQEPASLSDLLRSINLANGKERTLAIGNRLVCSRCRVRGPRRNVGGPRAVISIVFRGKSRGWETLHTTRTYLTADPNSGESPRSRRWKTRRCTRGCNVSRIIIAYATSNCLLSPLLATRKIRKRRSTSFFADFDTPFPLLVHLLRIF